MLDSDILRYRVATPGTTAEGQGRSQFEVEQVTDAAVRGGGIDDDTAGFHRFGVF